MRASIAIAAHNEGELLLKTVASCLEASEGLDCEVVVVDDASRDGSVAELRKHFGDLHIVSNARRTGTARAKDLAARSSRGDVIVFLDVHCKPEPNAIELMIRDVEDWRGEAIVSPRIETLDPERWVSGSSGGPGYGYWLDLEWFYSDWLTLEEMEATNGPRGRTFFRQPSFVGCCVAMSRELYEEIRGFDIGMLSWGSEDLDLGLRAWLMGRTILLDPEPIIGHRFRRDFDACYPIPCEHVLFNQIRMARKNFGDDAWNDWADRFRTKCAPELWRNAWQLYDGSRESVEQARDFVMGRRTRDEYRYAAEFGLVWPLTLSTSPFLAPEKPIRKRFSKPAPLTITHSPSTTPPQTLPPMPQPPTTTPPPAPPPTPQKTTPPPYEKPREK
jgi:GT2 family glycosyltransferase